MYSDAKSTETRRIIIMGIVFVCWCEEREGKLLFCDHQSCNCLMISEFQKIAMATAIGFAIMGFIGFFVKLIHIPINNIIVYVYLTNVAEGLKNCTENFLCSNYGDGKVQVCWFKTFMIIIIRCEVSHEVKLKAVDKSL